MPIGIDDVVLAVHVSSIRLACRFGGKDHSDSLPPEQALGCRQLKREKRMDLKGTVAVVTGGNGGLGQRICHALAAQGCHIAVVYAQSKDQADGVARDLEKHQVGAVTFACDVTSPSATRCSAWSTAW
ncbi:MAG: SDR family NAD(P)-dependent oxidoreductase [Rhodospirillales bacterium]|nr:SDR family NAD(P)-dependent oxidoreductase [Rhodospirillales bacterium]